MASTKAVAIQRARAQHLLQLSPVCHQKGAVRHHLVFFKMPAVSAVISDRRNTGNLSEWPGLAQGFSKQRDSKCLLASLTRTTLRRDGGTTLCSPPAVDRILPSDLDPFFKGAIGMRVREGKKGGGKRRRRRRKGDAGFGNLDLKN